MKSKELIKLLEEHSDGKDLPVLFCTGSAFQDGFMTIVDVISADGHFLVIKRVGKYGNN